MVGVAKVGLFGLMIVTFSLLVFNDIAPLFPYMEYVATLMTVLLIGSIYRIFYLRDTYVDSEFFSVDRVRSIRFALVYFLAIFVSGFAVLSLFFLVLAGISALVVTLLVTILNLLFAIVGVFMLIFTGDFVELIPYDIVFEVLDFVIGFSSVYENFEIANILIGSAFIVALAISSYFTGKYIEDSCSGFAISVMFHLVLFVVVVIIDLLEISEISVETLPLIVLILLTPVYSWYVMKWSFRKKAYLDDYQLPEVGKWGRRLMILPILVISAGGIVFSIIAIGELVASGSYPIVVYPLVGISALILIILSIFWLAWMRTGDFPVEIRIFEIEYREELLAKAKEFREME